MMFLWPILVLVAAGGALYAYTQSNKSSAQGLGAPQTGPQVLSRDQKIAFFKILPQLSVVEGPTDKNFASGTLEPTSQMRPADVVSAPALDIIYRANMTGNAILVAKDGETTMMLVPALGTETNFAKPGSNWFIILSPNEADAIASAAGVAIPDSAKIAPKPQGGANKSDPGKSGSGKTSFTPIAGNPFRSGAVKTMQTLRSTLNIIKIDDGHLDWTKLPDPPRGSIQRAVDSNDISIIVPWADSARDAGYATAAGQLYEIARGFGWAPSPTDHPEMMTFMEMIAPYNHPHILYQNQVTRLSVDGDPVPSPLFIAPDGWVEAITELYHRGLIAPLPGDDVNLRNNASALRTVNYIKAADELDALANTISPPAKAAPEPAPSPAPASNPYGAKKAGGGVRF